MRYDFVSYPGYCDTWPPAAWYAYCLGYPRDASMANLEAKLFNYACREGIVFG